LPLDAWREGGVAKHRVPDGEAEREAGPSLRALILAAVAVTVFVAGVIWAVIGPSHTPAAPAADGGPVLLVPPADRSPTQAAARDAATVSAVPVAPAEPGTQGAARAPGPRAAGPAPATSRPASPPRPGPSPASPTPAGALTVTARANSWPGVYSATYTVTNHSTSPVDGWTVVITFASPVTLWTAWNAQPRAQGSSVTFTAMSYNRRVAAGQSQSFGFIASGGGRTPVPVSCTVNGRRCSG
jgi:Cellulose binding domain